MNGIFETSDKKNYRENGSGRWGGSLSSLFNVFMSLRGKKIKYSSTHILWYHPFIKHDLQNVSDHVTLLGKLSNNAPLITEDAA